MKLLLFYAHTWWFKTASKSLSQVPDSDREESIENAVVVYFHAEKEDEDRSKSLLEKVVKNIKWLAGKFERNAEDPQAVMALAYRCKHYKFNRRVR